MGNLVSYLKWRGGLDFKEHGFCEADNLVFSALVYLDFSGIVPGNENGITVKKAAEEYFRLKEEGKRGQSAYESVLRET